ncbi:DUF5906 domain-containing protein [Methanosarcina sp. MTP4]|uniref:DUF5906 domain-containing protein n=1 Tax=Methanosarcina sp. MTP4 TaxID=1434100 RepID=UPI0012E0468B|nr:DUF5906 domain-containing protein [Methanosarcina sp. MTP4]
MNPAFFDMFNKGPENWTFADISEVIKILAGTYPKWSINRILETYCYGGKAWGELEEPTKLSLIESAINTAEQKDWIEAKNTDGIPLEFDGLYELHRTKEGDVKKVVLYNEEIADKIRRELNTLAFKDQLYVYSEGVYVEGEALVKAEIARTVKAIKAAKKGSNASVRGADAEIMYYIRYDAPHMKYPFNLHPDMIPVNNGIIRLNFETGLPELIPFSPKWLFNYKIPTDFNPNASSKPIDNVLRSYVDEVDLKVLYQIPAQALLQVMGRGPYKKCYLLQGRKDAGKSSYLELLYRTFGIENKSDVPLNELATGEHKFKLARLVGKLHNIHDELPNFPLKETGTLKRLLGAYSHDVEVKGRQPFSAFITAVLVFACNTPPKITNNDVKRDEAFWDKWEYVLFPNSFEKRDRFYEETFTPENLSGFLHNVIAAALRIGREGKLLKETDGPDVKDKWAKCSEPVYQFISKNMERSRYPTYFLKGDMLDILIKWGNDENLEDDIPQSKEALSKILKICGVTEAKLTGKDSGIQSPVYVFPYKWKEDSKYKADIKEFELKREQAKFN